MKKTALAVALFAVFVLTASNTKTEPKYTIQLNTYELQALWGIIDASAAPHTDVKAMQKIIQEQVAPQMDTTQKEKK